MGNADTVTILGARGTAPVEGAEVSRYGGATSCFLVRLGGELLVLDGGTGILDLERHLRPEERTVHLLLTHSHFDHLIGLPAWTALFDSRFAAHMYAASREGLSPLQQLQRLMEPPLWPVRPSDFGAAMYYHGITGDFWIGNVFVRTMEGAHPGGCTVFRLEWAGKSLVYATDYELDEESAPPLLDFARDCTLLLCDGQYTDAEMATHRGFGHSAWTAAARLAAECGAGRLRILHHAPWRTDKELDSAHGELERLFKSGAFARGGEEITI